MENVKKTKRPEKLTIEELEALGVTMTEWERKVIGNPGFCLLRQTGWPQWGQLAAGIRRVQTAFEGRPLGTYVDTEQGPLAPSQWRKQFDRWQKETSPAVRSVGIIAAQLAKTRPAQDPDWTLLQNLCAFLDQDSAFTRFRWEKEAAEKMEDQMKTVRVEVQRQRIAELRLGDTEVVVIGLGRLHDHERSALYRELISDLARRGFITEEEQKDDRYEDRRYLNQATCLLCPDPRPWEPSKNCHCIRIPFLVLTGTGVAKTWAEEIPRSYRRHIWLADFRVPKATFAVIPKDPDYLYPNLCLFDMSTPGRKDRQTLEKLIRSWLDTWTSNQNLPITDEPTYALRPLAIPRSHSLLLVAGPGAEQIATTGGASRLDHSLFHPPQITIGRLKPSF